MAATVKRRISAVWEYFEEPIVVPESGRDGKQVKKVACKLCDQQLTDGGGTTNLMSHLRAKHPEQYKRITDSATSSSSKQTTLSTAFHKCSPQQLKDFKRILIVRKVHNQLNIRQISE